MHAVVYVCAGVVCVCVFVCLQFQSADATEATPIFQSLDLGRMSVSVCVLVRAAAATAATTQPFVRIVANASVSYI